jgi:hypothetical protein
MQTNEGELAKENETKSKIRNPEIMIENNAYVNISDLKKTSNDILRQEVCP